MLPWRNHFTAPLKLNYHFFQYNTDLVNLVSSFYFFWKEKTTFLIVPLGKSMFSFMSHDV